MYARRWWVTALAVLAGAVSVVAWIPAEAGPVPGAFAEQVAAARAVERVRWAHRTWPEANPGQKPSLEAIVPGEVFRERVLDALAKSLALDRWWNRAPGAAELQAELDRMARETRAPGRLRELFAALGNDPALAAEALARPVLVERLLRSWYAGNPPPGARGEDGKPRPFDVWWASVRPGLVAEIENDPSLVWIAGPGDGLSLPEVDGQGCAEGTWSPLFFGAPDPARSASVVWTGSEMIVWGGYADQRLDRGWRYDPATDTWRPLPLDGAPSPRIWHTAVWTGSQMIVWGGWAGWQQPLGDGARYDPAADRWTPVALQDAPTPRYAHTAVWTGHEMIVWGGYTEDGRTATGGRYDPETDSWRPTGMDGAPSPQYRHVAAWTGREMIVWPGSGWRACMYDPATDRWRQGTSEGAPRARERAVGAWTGSCLAVWGGNTGEILYGDGGCYDPVADRWEAIAEEGAPSPRTEHAGAWGDGKLFIWGGRSPDGETLGDGALWIAADNRWEPIASTGAPGPRGRHVACWTGREFIVWGGVDPYGNDAESLNSGGRYDPVTRTWVPTRDRPDGPSPRSRFPGVWTGNEFVAWGGRDQETVLGDGASWDPATAAWTPMGDPGHAPSPRYYHVGVWTGREVFYWGGVNGVIADPEILLGDGGRWDPVARRWLPVSVTGAPSPRLDHTAVWSGTEVIVWGGYDFRGTLPDGRRYDPRTDTWRPMARNPDTPLGVHEHAAAWTGETMVVWGGEWVDPQTGESDWVEHGSRYHPGLDLWQRLPDENAPSPREYPQVTWTGEFAIFWGGWNGDYLDTGGRYDPRHNRWLPMATEGAPEGRYFHGQAWTGKHLLVWGGWNDRPLRSGGRYDPREDRWEPLPVEGAPQGAYDLGVAWTGEEFIAWGGRPSTSSGGTYCAPCGEFSWYRDADGDGHGDPADEVEACTAPAGYVAVGDDCDDTDPRRYPGRPEACNGVDDDCDGTVDEPMVPPGKPVLFVEAAPGGVARLSWSEVAGADAYDVDRGELGTLHETGRLFDSVNRCLADDLADTELEDPEQPSAEDGWWYLVRAVNCTGPGTFDTGAPRQEGSRDAALRGHPDACP